MTTRFVVSSAIRRSPARAIPAVHDEKEPPTCCAGVPSVLKDGGCSVALYCFMGTILNFMCCNVVYNRNGNDLCVQI